MNSTNKSQEIIEEKLDLIKIINEIIDLRDKVEKLKDQDLDMFEYENSVINKNKGEVTSHLYPNSLAAKMRNIKRNSNIVKVSFTSRDEYMHKSSHSDISDNISVNTKNQTHKTLNDTIVKGFVKYDDSIHN